MDTAKINRATGHSFTTGMVRTKLCYHTLAMPCHTQLTSTSVSSSGSPSRVPPSPSPPSPLPTREMVCGRSLHRSRKLDLCTQKYIYIYIYILPEGVCSCGGTETESGINWDLCGLKRLQSKSSHKSSVSCKKIVTVVIRQPQL